MEAAAQAGARLIGINNRDLRTFTTDLGTSERLARLRPPGAILVAESGLQSGADLARLRHAGIDGFLIGERFMTALNPGTALSSLVAEARQLVPEARR